MRVNEVFTSIQGEGSRAGLMCTFVRFTTCNLRCTYCDTEYAFYEGEKWERAELVENVCAPGVSLICVTGGEPLLQRELVPFLEELLGRGTTVLLETGGSRCLADIPKSVIKIVDVKTPGAIVSEPSAQTATSPEFLDTHFHYPNLELLLPHDEVKFVVTSRDDYLWATQFVSDHNLARRVDTILMSPCHGKVDPGELAVWMRDDHFPGRLNLQLHKYIWGVDTRGV